MTLEDELHERQKQNVSFFVLEMAFTWNPNDLYFWMSAPQLNSN